MNPIPKYKIYTFYTVLTSALVIVGLRYGKKASDEEYYGALGFFGGLLISYGLWEFWGRANSY